MPYPQDLLRLLFRFYKGIQASLIYAQSVENPIKGVASENLSVARLKYLYIILELTLNLIKLLITIS